LRPQNVIKTKLRRAVKINLIDEMDRERRAGFGVGKAARFDDDAVARRLLPVGRR
jgi:hypothetical protein